MHAPTYFYLNTNSNLSAKIALNDLTGVSASGIIKVVSDGLTEGGCCDTYDERVLNSQGGGNRTGCLRVNGQADADQRRIAGPKGRQCLADLSDQVRGVEKSNAGSIGKTGRGKVSSSTIAGWNVPQLETLKHVPVNPYYRFVYCTSGRYRNAMQHLPLRPDVRRHGGSVGKDKPIMAITSPHAHDGQNPVTDHGTGYTSEYVGIYISRDVLANLIARGYLEEVSDTPYFRAPEPQPVRATCACGQPQKYGAFCPACWEEEWAADWVAQPQEIPAGCSVVEACWRQVREEQEAYDHAAD
jgi:hypothetical protein